MKTAPAALVALLVIPWLAGCSGGSDDTAAPAPRASASEPAVAAADEGVISPANLPADPTFSNEAQGVIDDVAVEQCDSGPGKVTASGTATNSGKWARDVVVTISWTVGSTGDVVAKAIGAVRDLEPGESGDWAIEARVKGSQAAACVPQALAGQMKG